MDPLPPRAGHGRLIVGAILLALTLAGVALTAQRAGRHATTATGPAGSAGSAVGAGTEPAPATSEPARLVVSAAEGAAARARLDRLQSDAVRAARTNPGRLAADPVGPSTTPPPDGPGSTPAPAAAAMDPVGAETGTTAPAALCADDGADYQPTAADLASANAETDALAAVFTTFGIAHSRSTDAMGYTSLDWDYDDAVARAVSDSFWTRRYPPEAPSADDLARATAENDVIARHLAAAAIAYTRASDPQGWETIHYDESDPAAAAAVEAAYAELYPPLPPTAEELATARADNDRLAAAFDAAGIAYTRMSDELGWEWLTWDYRDPDTQARVDTVLVHLYPPDNRCPPGSGEPVDEPPTAPGGALVPASPGTTGAAPAVTTPGGGPGTTADPNTAANTAAMATADAAEGAALEASPTPDQTARHNADIDALSTGFQAAGVTHQLIGEPPWRSLVFDIDNPAAVPVVASVLAHRP